MGDRPAFSRDYIFQLVNTTDGNPTKLERVYDFVQLIAIILSITPLAFRDYTPFLATMEYCCVSLFILDNLFRWITADIKLKKAWLSSSYLDMIGKLKHKNSETEQSHE